MKSNNAGIFVQCSSALNWKEVWTYYFAIYLPSIGYPLPNYHFTHTQLHKIQSKGMGAIFSKCNFNHNTKGFILYCLFCLGGTSFCHLYTEQALGQIQSFLKHWHCSMQPGQLLCIAVLWMQYAEGTGCSFLTNVSTPLPHLKSKWLHSFWHFLLSINGSIELDKAFVYCLLCWLHHFYLMDSVTSINVFISPNLCMTSFQ